MGLSVSKSNSDVLYIPPRKRRGQHKEKPHHSHPSHPHPARAAGTMRRRAGVEPPPNSIPLPTGPRKVMTQRELSIWLESMGFSRESVGECLQNLQFRGNKAIIDANVLVEQLLQRNPLVQQQQLASPLRRSNRLRNSRNISQSLSLSSSSFISPQASSATSNSISSSTSATSLSTPISTSTTTTTSSSNLSNSGVVSSNLLIPASPINRISPFAPSPIATIRPNYSTSSPIHSPHRSLKCKICFEKQIDTVILRCGHLCVCSRCAPKLKDCPICRQEIVEIVKIYQC